ncbi:MAG: hypothetical protein LWX11_07275 [Firmicutes bacterium]|nr:hypothetical protein [Bacillota bacterium]
METTPRRDILGSVASLLAAPLLLDKEAVAATFLPQEKDAEARPALVLNPPAHSVKRRG